MKTKITAKSNLEQELAKVEHDLLELTASLQKEAKLLGNKATKLSQAFTKEMKYISNIWMIKLGKKTAKVLHITSKSLSNVSHSIDKRQKERELILLRSEILTELKKQDLRLKKLETPNSKSSN